MLVVARRKVDSSPKESQGRTWDVGGESTGDGWWVMGDERIRPPATSILCDVRCECTGLVIVCLFERRRRRLGDEG